METLFAYFNQTSDTSNSTLPIICPDWQAASNSATNYGNTVAYPAAPLLIQCIPYTLDGYSCAQPAAASTSNGVIIQDFWSTSAVDPATDQPVARLVLDVAMLDMGNQTMLMGAEPCYALTKCCRDNHALHVLLFD